MGQGLHVDAHLVGTRRRREAREAPCELALVVGSFHTAEPPLICRRRNTPLTLAQKTLPMADASGYPGVPRWVRMSGFIAIALAFFVLFVIVAGAGPHGPARHVQAGAAPSHGPAGLFVLLGVLLVGGIALNWSAAWSWLPQMGGMPIMTPGARKLVLAAHIAASVGALGAVASFLALSMAGLASETGQTARAAYVAMELTARFVIVPLLFASLLSGLVQSLGSTWGLLRHYWVVVKLLLNVLVIVVLLLQMEGISHMARVAAESALSGTDLLALRRSLRTHAAGGLVVLLVPLALSIYKPKGLTPYGWRRQQQSRT